MGHLGPLLGLIFILVAIYKATNWFTLTDYPLSSLGVEQEGREDWKLYFNTGVILAGLGASGFAWGLHGLYGRNSPTEEHGTRLLLVGATCLVLVGLVPMDHELPHTLFALGFFALLPFGILLLGNTWQLEPTTTSMGFRSSILARYLLFILLLLITVGAAGSDALAIPELMSIIPMSIWQWWMSSKLWRYEPTND